MMMMMFLFLGERRASERSELEQAGTFKVHGEQQKATQSDRLDILRLQTDRGGGDPAGLARRGSPKDPRQQARRERLWLLPQDAARYLRTPGAAGGLRLGQGRVSSARAIPRQSQGAKGRTWLSNRPSSTFRRDCHPADDRRPWQVSPLGTAADCRWRLGLGSPRFARGGGVVALDDL